MHKKYVTKKEDVNEIHSNRLMARYGDAGKPAPNPELILGQTESYVEYSRDGRLVKGQEKMAPKSKYPEQEELEAPKKKCKADEEAEKEANMKKALEKYDKQKQEYKDDVAEGERKRGYNSMKSTEVTEEDMEVYRLKKIRSDDPMAKFLKD